MSAQGKQGGKENDRVGVQINNCTFNAPVHFDRCIEKENVVDPSSAHNALVNLTDEKSGKDDEDGDKDGDVAVRSPSRKRPRRECTKNKQATTSVFTCTGTACQGKYGEDIVVHCSTCPSHNHYQYGCITEKCIPCCAYFREDPVDGSEVTQCLLYAADNEDDGEKLWVVTASNFNVPPRVQRLPIKQVNYIARCVAKAKDLKDSNNIKARHSALNSLQSSLRYACYYLFAAWIQEYKHDELTITLQRAGVLVTPRSSKHAKIVTLPACVRSDIKMRHASLPEDKDMAAKLEAQLQAQLHGDAEESDEDQ